MTKKDLIMACADAYRYCGTSADRIMRSKEALLAAVEAMTQELEQLQVQLAGCGVAATQNTDASKADRAKQGDYGYSESYAEVCRAVDREITLRQELETAKLHIKHIGNDALRTENHELRQELEAAKAETEMWKATANAVVDFEKVTLRQELEAAKATTYRQGCKECADAKQVHEFDAEWKRDVAKGREIIAAAGAAQKEPT